MKIEEKKRDYYYLIPVRKDFWIKIHYINFPFDFFKNSILKISFESDYNINILIFFNGYHLNS